MQILQGIGVSPGVAIGEALVIDNEGFRIPRRFVTRDAVDDEIERLDAAINSVAEEIERDRNSVKEQLGEQIGGIFSAHLQMVRDEKLRIEIVEYIRERHYSPEYAVSRVLRRYAKVFENLGTPHAHDIFDLEKAILRNLLGLRREELTHLASPVIVLASDLTPSETAHLDKEFVRGFATEIGGAGGHTAIVAKGLEIPAVVGVDRFLTDVSGGDLIIVDGDSGRVILQPDEETVARYRHELEQHKTLATRLQSLRELSAQTTDGVNIQLLGNIEFPYEVNACLQHGANGVGLYRTEFLYLQGDQVPTEEVHFQAYSDVVRAMGDRTVVIRTLDLGADKVGGAAGRLDERNPFLGLRSIRLSLNDIPLFRIQLRAVLRASAMGSVRLMFPLISTLPELRRAKMVLADVMEDLEEEGEPFDRDLKVGIMVETPSAVMLIDEFAREVDFFSIGTNDLIQYTLAVDRTNRNVAYLYHDADPSVLRLIARTIESAKKAGIPVSLCGQMSGLPIFTMLLLGMGLRSLSLPPSAAPEVKKICRSVDIPHCRGIRDRVLKMDNAAEIEKMLREELRRIAPELVMT